MPKKDVHMQIDDIIYSAIGMWAAKQVPQPRSFGAAVEILAVRVLRDDGILIKEQEEDEP